MKSSCKKLKGQCATSCSESETGISKGCSGKGCTCCVDKCIDKGCLEMGGHMVYSKKDCSKNEEHSSEYVSGHKKCICCLPPETKTTWTPTVIFPTVPTTERVIHTVFNSDKEVVDRYIKRLEQNFNNITSILENIDISEINEYKAYDLELSVRAARRLEIKVDTILKNDF